MTPEQWVSTQIKDRGIKQKFIAEKAGIDQKKLSFSLTGRRRLTVGEFLAVCEAAEINPSKYPGNEGEECA